MNSRGTRAFLFLLILGISFNQSLEAAPPPKTGACQELGNPPIDLTQQEPLRSFRPYYQYNYGLQVEPALPTRETSLCYAITATQMYDFIRAKSEINRLGRMPSSGVRQSDPVWTAAHYASATANELLPFLGEFSPVERRALQDIAKNPDHPVGPSISAFIDSTMFERGGVSCVALKGLNRFGSCNYELQEVPSSGPFHIGNALMLQCYLTTDVRSFISPSLGACFEEDEIESCPSMDQMRRMIIEDCNWVQKTQAQLGCSIETLTSAAEGLTKIHAQLEKGYPIPVDVCYQMFRPSKKGSTAAYIQKSPTDGRLLPANGCAGHSVLAVGRRWNTERCSFDFLIRDSYPHARSNGVTNDVWVSQESLEKHIFRVLEVTGLP